MKNFEKIIVTYHSDDIIPYPEYKGKPYFSIQYEENGEHHIGYGTYNPQVLSGYIKDYFNDRASMVEELEKAKEEINDMLNSDEVKNDKWANVIINKSYLFKRIINNRISELKEEMNRGNIIEKPFNRTDDCLSYEESFCEARDCGECCCREIKGE